jgi:hypothetical protein
VEISVDLTTTQRQIRTCIIDIISTCVRELKQCTHGVEVETEDEGAVAARAALRPSPLEIELRKSTLMLTERQERLLNDLQILRKLLEKAENLDPVSVHTLISELRSSKEVTSITKGKGGSVHGEQHWMGVLAHSQEDLRLSGKPMHCQRRARTVHYHS